MNLNKMTGKTFFFLCLSTMSNLESSKQTVVNDLFCTLCQINLKLFKCIITNIYFWIWVVICVLGLFFMLGLLFMLIHCHRIYFILFGGATRQLFFRYLYYIHILIILALVLLAQFSWYPVNMHIFCIMVNFFRILFFPVFFYVLCRIPLSKNKLIY